GDGGRAGDRGGSGRAGAVHGDRGFFARVPCVRSEAEAGVRGGLRMFALSRGSALTSVLDWWHRAATRAPLPVGERSAHEVRRVRGARTIENARPPHPLASLATSPQRGEGNSWQCSRPKELSRGEAEASP